MSIEQRLARVKEQLRRHGQEQLLRFWGELDGGGRERLLGDIEAIDFPELAPLIESHVKREPELHLPRSIQPADMLPNEPVDAAMAGRFEQARKVGRELLAGGKVALLTVAGGQGTRLGFDGPKGAFPVTPIRGKTLFRLFAEMVANAGRRCGTPLPWLIMTSPTNDAPTREFFAGNNHFGLSPEQVVFFTQGQMPALSFEGEILLADKDSVALSPNGHGGTLKALHSAGVLDRLADGGVEVISYFQVDNPLIHPADELFLGLHAQAGAQISNKTIPKAGPTERVGNFCLADGKLMVIEYSDLPDELAHATAAGGGRLFDAGSIAIHLFDVGFVQRLNQGGFHLPFHRAVKKVPHVDAAGRLVEPDAPNAVKLETFVFDALPLAERTLLWQTRRDEEFAPVKNATGTDSLETAQAAMIERSARWLESAGVSVPRTSDGRADCVLEISPLLAESADQLRSAIAPEDVQLRPGDELYLGAAGE